MSPRPDTTRRPANPLADLLEETARVIRRTRPLAHRLEHDFNPGPPAGRPGPPHPLVWCDTHQRDIRTCHRWCNTHNQPTDRCHTDGRTCQPYLCTGVPLVLPTDTTGDTAVNSTHHGPTLTHLERQLVTALHNYAARLKNLTGMRLGDLQPTEHDHRPSLGGNCLACTRYVAGTEHDRLRAGLCDTDRKHWERHRDEYPDRAAWLRARRAQLADEPTVVHVDPTQPRTRTDSWTATIRGHDWTATIRGVDVPADVAAAWWATHLIATLGLLSIRVPSDPGDTSHPG